MNYNPYGSNDLFLNINASFYEKTLIAVCKFVDKKAPYFTLLAFSKALAAFHDAKLILAGDGSLLNMCTNLVDYLNIADAVSFPRVVKQEEFKNVLKTCRACVQHSITSNNGDMEGTPVAILEAQAAGVPVISTFHAGIPDVVENNKTGILVNEKDVDAMADAMIRLLRDEVIAKKMGENGRQNILANFTMSIHIEFLNNLISNIAVK